MSVFPESWLPQQTQWDDLLNRIQNLEQVIEAVYEHNVRAEFFSVEGLSDTLTIKVPELPVQLQFNPHRLHRGVSTVVHSNPIHIIPYKDGVPCFCCPGNIAELWPQERGYKLGLNSDLDPLVFLPNIYPIFPFHFTVVTEAHLPQVLSVAYVQQLTQRLPSYWLVQNGAQAGATNPWHYHLQVFQASLPLEKATVESLTSHTNFVAKVVHPASVYRFRLKQPTDWERLDQCLSAYLKCSDTYRFNVLAKYNGSYTDCFVALRDTQKATTLYKKGQPGYAEIGGLISPSTDEAFQNWQLNGPALYHQLMTEIRVSADTEAQFELLLNAV